jgi:hypothetical protein
MTGRSLILTVNTMLELGSAHSVSCQITRAIHKNVLLFMLFLVGNKGGGVNSAPGKISTWSVGHQSLINSAQLFMHFVPMGGCPRHVVHAH